MESLLERIIEARRARVEEAKRRRKASDLESEMPEPPRDMHAALGADGISIIAEFKRRSPSAGDIRPDRSPSEMAKRYEEGGARAMSVLTEPDFFEGGLEDLRAAKASCSLPVLRKDFIIDPYQVIESRAAGADAILLIAAALDDSGLFADLAAAARDLGLAAIVEVHDEAELTRALEHDPSIIGINQRDLRTFEVDTELTIRLRPSVPDGILLVAESGIRSVDQMRALTGVADAVLIGESLMRAEDPASELRGMLEEVVR